KSYHRDKDYRKLEAMYKNMFQKRVNLAQRFAKKGRVLDVGASNGGLLDILKKEGWETWGVEPSKNALIAKKKGHKIFKDYFEKVELPEASFDLVTFNHTLEHMDEPLAVLKKVGSLLKKGGTLFVDVPNRGGLSAKVLGKRWPYLLPNEHKWQFTRQSLTNLFRKAGFTVVHFESRSGIFEYENPLQELGRKRFVIDILTFPYALVVTLLSVGDSMSLVGKKK
ncbi:MAG: class I SAM-dependent methyltransferase, partial [Patescibacteria group bacterium]